MAQGKIEQKNRILNESRGGSFRGSDSNVEAIEFITCQLFQTSEKLRMAR